MKKSIENFFLWRLLIRLEQYILVICSSGAMLVIVLSVIMRYILKSDLYGIEEIIVPLALWLYFIGGAYGSYEGSHISADIITELIKSPKIIRGIKIFIAGAVLFCSAVFAKWGLDFIGWSIKVGGKSTSLQIPLLLSRIPLTICFVLMVLYSIYHLINVIMGRKPKIMKIGGGLE